MLSVSLRQKVKKSNFHFVKNIKGNYLFPFFLLIFWLLSGCHRDNNEALSESKAVLNSLYSELKALNSRHDLSQRQEVLERKFLDLAQSLIHLRELEITLGPIEEKAHGSIQKEILNELQRLYQIDGCQELIEHAEAAALEMIDKYEHSRDILQRKRERSLK